MSLVETISIDDLQNQVIRRNCLIESLKKCSSELINRKHELDEMMFDGCHAGASYVMADEYALIIKKINSMIRLMQNGDWCFSVESTKEREKEFPCGECGKNWR